MASRQMSKNLFKTSTLLIVLLTGHNMSSQKSTYLSKNSSTYLLPDDSVGILGSSRVYIHLPSSRRRSVVNSTASLPLRFPVSNSRPLYTKNSPKVLGTYTYSKYYLYGYGGTLKRVILGAYDVVRSWKHAWSLCPLILCPTKTLNIKKSTYVIF